MKSEKAQFYLSERSIPHYELPTMTGDTITAIELEDAIKAVEMAEDKAESSHAEELKELAKAHIRDIRELSQMLDEALDARVEAEREKATDAFCDLCFVQCPIGISCEKLDSFIQKIKR